MRNIDFNHATFKDFENPEGMSAYERAAYFNEYLDFQQERGQLNYRLMGLTPSGPTIDMDIPGYGGRKPYVCLVSNDYMNFSQHPLVKKAAMDAIRRWGTGSGASPAIGGHYEYHQELEDKIARFFFRDAAMLLTTGYTANSATMLSLLQEKDLAIIDMAVHASMHEGVRAKNSVTFMHNNIEHLEKRLKESYGKFQTVFVIVDGVYSQDGDIAKLDQIAALAHAYGAYVVMDDAHGTGVIGDTGRGVVELYNLYDKIDIMTGTLSKTFGHLGGYVVASPELIRFLKFQSRQHLFSVTSSPAVVAASKAIDLIDEEPDMREALWENIRYFKSGLISMGLDVGTTESAIIPVKVRNLAKTHEINSMLLHAGIYATPSMYPAVSKKDSRIRMSLMATHTRPHLDKVLNAFDDIRTKIDISQKESERQE
ncbi:aminotransferase class I/II-fold pyridoxal phosphate-dependent enzyme [Pedobacter paludis]|uniref:2-amino-3-ketobutyrate CoA ligase n=1 Tax=Pedobacter paludis TaxID=2203212 RepID=A0A317F289_9SPHI|nr:aminotransferase class I/II-fold pyridoxal phosphate-dependent enzyme [Pedobacter paludis]PWS33350.1 2-amino-3-ketobutyrate CoA ligase [Pedobacter paludis]